MKPVSCKMKRLISLGLSLVMLSTTVLTGCGSKEVTPQTEAETVQETETTALAPETVLETETEEETVSIYFEDGSRKGWITASGNVNVRAKASKKGAFVGSFIPRQVVKLLSEEPENGFYHVAGTDDNTGSEIEGYTSADFITLDPPPSPKVKLDVVSYLQDDVRWGENTLGKTSLKMKDKGCATTCLAMSESFLKEQEILPDYIEENNIYTSDGNIGWPDDYYWNWNNYNYMEFVLEKLHEGIPILINRHRANGTQHWVLIVGYKGDGEKLEAKDFLINDPLPKGRVTLQDFIDDFPYFSKMIYYVGDRSKVEGSEEYESAQKELKKQASKKKKSKKN